MPHRAPWQHKESRAVGCAARLAELHAAAASVLRRHPRDRAPAGVCGSSRLQRPAGGRGGRAAWQPTALASCRTMRSTVQPRRCRWCRSSSSHCASRSWIGTRTCLPRAWMRCGARHSGGAQSRPLRTHMRCRLLSLAVGPSLNEHLPALLIQASKKAFDAKLKEKVMETLQVRAGRRTLPPLPVPTCCACGVVTDAGAVRRPGCPKDDQSESAHILQRHHVAQFAMHNCATQRFMTRDRVTCVAGIARLRATHTMARRRVAPRDALPPLTPCRAAAGSSRTRPTGGWGWRQCRAGAASSTCA